MVDPKDPQWLEFQATAQAALTDIVANLEAQGFTTADAIDDAFGRLKPLLFQSSSTHDHVRPGDELPPFDEHGMLPATHLCSMEELVRRFGESTDRRKTLISHVVRVVKLAQDANGLRLIVGGSFVTAKPEPSDVDMAILLPESFFRNLNDVSAANQLWELSQGQTRDFPIGLYLERDETAWWSWFRLFSSCRYPVHVYRGVVEIRL